MLAMDAIPATLYFVLLFAVPESPRWLFGRGQVDQAKGILTLAGGAEQAGEELRNIARSFSEKAPRARLVGLVGPRMRFIMFVALAIAFFQQITGINAVFYYLPTIFAQTGGGIDAAFKQAVLVGLVNLGMTFVAIRYVDRLGRKPLLLIGATGMAISLLTCSWAFHDSSFQLSDKSLVVLRDNKIPEEVITRLQAAERTAFPDQGEFLASLESSLGAENVAKHKDALVTAGLNIRAWLVLGAILGFVASFAISLGPVMWVLLSEIFPNQYRGVAMSVVGFWNSAISASVTFIFPWELSHFGTAGTFLGYGVMAALAVVFVGLFVPETKGKSLEELEGLLMRH
jgi:MFS family permease